MCVYIYVCTYIYTHTHIYINDTHTLNVYKQFGGTPTKLKYMSKERPGIGRRDGQEGTFAFSVIFVFL